MRSGWVGETPHRPLLLHTCAQTREGWDRGHLPCVQPLPSSRPRRGSRATLLTGRETGPGGQWLAPGCAAAGRQRWVPASTGWLLAPAMPTKIPAAPPFLVLIPFPGAFRAWISKQLES